MRVSASQRKYSSMSIQMFALVLERLLPTKENPYLQHVYLSQKECLSNSMLKKLYPNLNMLNSKGFKLENLKERLSR